MPDCESVDRDLPIRQGDVLKAVGGKHEFLLVMTADCDIAHHRFGDAGIACVRLQPLSSYLLEDVARGYCVRNLGRRYSKLADWIQIYRLKADSGALPIEPARLKEWLQVSPLELIESALALPEEKVGHFRKEAEALRAAQRALEGHDGLRPIDSFGALQSKPMAQEEQVRTLVGLVDPRDLPLDVFFVSAIPGESAIGFLAKLRAIVFVPFDLTFTSMAAAKEREPSYIRVGRLAPTFRHAVAQQFGMLFSRIGFPTSYENDREVAFSMVVDDICSLLEKDRD